MVATRSHAAAEFRHPPNLLAKRRSLRLLEKAPPHPPSAAVVKQPPATKPKPKKPAPSRKPPAKRARATTAEPEPVLQPQRRPKSVAVRTIGQRPMNYGFVEYDSEPEVTSPLMGPSDHSTVTRVSHERSVRYAAVNRVLLVEPARGDELDGGSPPVSEVGSSRAGDA